MVQPMIERRQDMRRRTLLTGQIEFLNRSVFDCVIRNLSDCGARITCDQQIALPDIFEVVFVKQNQRRRVRAMWRGDGVMGVSFLAEDEYRNVLPFEPRLAPN